MTGKTGRADRTGTTKASGTGADLVPDLGTHRRLISARPVVSRVRVAGVTVAGVTVTRISVAGVSVAGISVTRIAVAIAPRRRRLVPSRPARTVPLRTAVRLLTILAAVRLITVGLAAVRLAMAAVAPVTAGTRVNV